MSIQTAALGNDGDIFVGGSFESRVWDGHHFVNVYHVAHFDGKIYLYIINTCHVRYYLNFIVNNILFIILLNFNTNNIW